MGKLKDLVIEADEMIRELPKSYRGRWKQILQVAFAETDTKNFPHLLYPDKTTAEIHIISGHLLEALAEVLDVDDSYSLGEEGVDTSDKPEVEEKFDPERSHVDEGWPY